MLHLKLHDVCMIKQKVTMGYITPAVKYPTVVISAKEAVSQFVIPAKSCEVGCEPGSRKELDAPANQLPEQAYQACPRPDRESGMTVIGYLSPG